MLQFGFDSSSISLIKKRKKQDKYGVTATRINTNYLLQHRLNSWLSLDTADKRGIKLNNIETLARYIKSIKKP
jgi:uridylate kinase